MIYCERFEKFERCEKLKMRFRKKIALFLATGCGIGLVAPFAPGTFGSLPGVALAYVVTLLPLALQIPTCLVLTLLAIPICDSAEKTLGIVDDGRITADEWMLFPIAVIGLPFHPLPSTLYPLPTLPWWSMIVFFCVVRIIDIIKPPPARKLQAIPGGRGIVIDDFFANLYSLVVNWAIYLLLFR